MQFPFTPGDQAAIASMIYAEAGIVLAASKGQLVYGRLARRVRACGLERFADYVALIERDTEERSRAVDALTTNHTGFFRENHHFEQFMADAWPPLAARLRAGGRVRLWSAACSSGEEPYSLAMAILGRDRAIGREIARLDLRMLATDLSSEILAAAGAARFPLDTLKTVPAPLRTAWMEPHEGEAAMRPEARDWITFRALNLLGPWPMRQPFDAIFCRNVMIYFDEPTKERLQTRLAAQLAPGGHLYIGHSERLATSLASQFTLVGRTMYRKVA
jgi:chemotaxis protein methyltransferase CheR